MDIKNLTAEEKKQLLAELLASEEESAAIKKHISNTAKCIGKTGKAVTVSVGGAILGAGKGLIAGGVAGARKGWGVRKKKSKPE
jgi:hypothetical protein